MSVKFVCDPLHSSAGVEDFHQTRQQVTEGQRGLRFGPGQGKEPARRAHCA